MLEPLMVIIGAIVGAGAAFLGMFVGYYLANK